MDLTLLLIFVIGIDAIVQLLRLKTARYTDARLEQFIKDMDGADVHPDDRPTALKELRASILLSKTSLLLSNEQQLSKLADENAKLAASFGNAIGELSAKVYAQSQHTERVWEALTQLAEFSGQNNRALKAIEECLRAPIVMGKLEKSKHKSRRK